MCMLDSVMSRAPDQLLSLDEFSLLHDKYPNTISATYFVVRDQFAKNEFHKMGLKDGLPLGLDCYCIMGRSKASDIKRILIPWPVDKELDLLWLSRCLNWCKDEDILEVFLCFYSGESIIMASRSVMPAGGTKVKRVMTQAINLIFEFMKNKERVQIWLYENVAMKLEGIIIGFDEYMNVVLDTAEEVYIKSGNRKTIGRILLKGDCITLIQRVDPKSGASL